jgi:hypothetical protein
MRNSCPIQLVGGDAGRHVPADLGQGLGRDPAGHPHPLDGGGVLDLRLAGGRVAAADVLGAGDAGRDRAHRGNPAGLEQGRHDLGV